MSAAAPAATTPPTLPLDCRVPLARHERDEEKFLLGLFAERRLTAADKVRLQELTRAAEVNGDSIFEPGSATVEVWIRTTGTRRQAFSRSNPAATWSAMQVPAAERAVRDGMIALAGQVLRVTVSRETCIEPEHPQRAAFAAQARDLCAQMDELEAGAAMKQQRQAGRAGMGARA